MISDGCIDIRGVDNSLQQCPDIKPRSSDNEDRLPLMNQFLNDRPGACGK
ncbi:MAG: hypothetical protein BWX55_01694 [Deltaproteobacteria bacterium ADurb.Bin022]|nr:MAG: hypothetical protein BWX55_01694 [Deltaproteobacteria bacterium ADurb.Bin022]